MYMFLSFTELSGGKSQLIFPIEKLNLKDKEAAVRYMNEHTEDVCKNLSHRFSSWPFDVLESIQECMVQWIWGRKYDFLQNMNVREAAEMCKKRKIPFPEVNIPSEDVKKPKDFYVFKGTNTPTVIHIPLFNVVNCGGKFRFSC
ncbi:hypothetical protein cypCar_00042393 [Cyprinus carpio]|nr:hypothetical protein cypCar_00042393 [Cyprinus carpio]